MKKLLTFLILALMATAVFANGIWEDVDTENQGIVKVFYNGASALHLKEKSFYFPFTVNCTSSGVCGGKIDVYLQLTGGLEVEGKQTSMPCYITAVNRGCAYNKKINLKKGTTGTIKVKAVMQVKTGENLNIQYSDPVSVDWYVGSLKGAIDGPSKAIEGVPFDVDVEYSCSKAVCFDVLLKTNHEGFIGGDEYNCGMMDYQETCKHTFEFEAVESGSKEISVQADSFLPTSSDDPEPIKILVEKSAEEQEDVVPPSTQKNIFQIIWDWITGLFR